MRALILHFALPFFLCLSHSSNFVFGDTNEMAPKISPYPEPLLPLFLAPSPMIPLINNTHPNLSGVCKLNFSSVERLMSVTAIDCWDPFAPYLANVMCCPQFEATWLTLTGHSALDPALHDHCLSDFEKILAAKGATPNLREICSAQPEALLGHVASCHVSSLGAFEAGLVSACDDVDGVGECCERGCQNAVTEAARSIAGEASSDCEAVVLRWLAGKLDVPSANAVLRVLSNCKVNQDCPLTFPATTSMVEECGPTMRSHVACCDTVKDYMSKLEEQSFVTNVQALNCAASLGKRLQKENMTRNIYDLCHISIKDFSLQVGSQEFGCLLPSLPSDATYDRKSGISFICDLNDNIAAPWPSSSSHHISLCNKTTDIPALPKATSACKGHHEKRMKILWFFSSLVVIEMLL